MGWKDTHLHEFVIQDQYFGVLEEGDVDVRKTLDESKYRLDDVVSGDDCRFTYEYDMGDNWEHVLLVEKLLLPQEGVRYPVCLAGARACPPEDVGGIPLYDNFLKAIRDPKHPEHKEFLEWIGSGFDPEKFDLAEVNQILRAMR